MSLSLRRTFIALATADFDGTVNFYQTLLGQSPKPLLPQRYAEFQLSGGLRLALFPPKPEQQAEFALASAGPLSFCLEVEDLTAAIAHLDQLNCRHGEILKASHGQEVYAYDPQGNRIILYQPYPKTTASGNSDASPEPDNSPEPGDRPY